MRKGYDCNTFVEHIVGESGGETERPESWASGRRRRSSGATAIEGEVLELCRKGQARG